MDTLKLIYSAAPRLFNVPAELNLARIVAFEPGGVGAQVLEYKRVENGWEHTRVIPAPELVELGENQHPSAVESGEQRKQLMVRAFGLSRYLQKDPAAVRTLFMEVWGGQLGAHMHDKLHYNYNDEVDTWYCSLGDAQRQKFLTHPQLDFSNH